MHHIAIKRLLLALSVLGLILPPSLGTARPAAAQQAGGRQRVVTMSRAVRVDPKRLPRTAPQARGAVQRSLYNPARMSALKKQQFHPSAPARLARDRAPVSTSGPQPLASAFSRGFEGPSQADNAAAGFLANPPDPGVAAGINHVVVVVNSLLTIYTRNGTKLLQTPLASWFGSVCAPPPGASPCFPYNGRVAYDPLENRWIVVAIHKGSAPDLSYILISVSTTSDPTAPWYHFNVSGVVEYSPGEWTYATFPDVGVDGISSTATPKGAVYITTNNHRFSDTVFKTAVLHTIPKYQLYTGVGGSHWILWDRLTASGTQAFAVRAAEMLGNPGVEYMVSSESLGGNAVSLWTVIPNEPPVSMSWTLEATMIIGGYGLPPDATQPGCASVLETLDNRLSNAMWRNGRLYTSFTEGAGAVSRIRYLKINTATHAAELDLTYGADGMFYFMPAIAVDGRDNIHFAFNRSSSTEYASVVYASHRSGAPGPEASAVRKAGVQCFTGGYWGSYSSAAADPVATAKIWIISEWASDLAGIDPSSDWGTWFGTLQFGVTMTAGLYAPATSQFFLRNSHSPGPADVPVFTFGTGGAGWKPIAGDWNGDGIQTVGLYDGSTGTFRLRNTNSAGAADHTFVYGPANAGWIPVAGDWDGDGDETVGLYDPATGNWFLRNSNSAGPADVPTFMYGPGGNVGWSPLAGDWNADGTESPGLYDPGSGFFFLRNSNTAGNADYAPFVYGPVGLGWIPLAGDWEGDSNHSIGLFSPSSSQWFLRNAKTAGPAEVPVYQYGPAGAGWIPFVGDWDGR